jgi:isoquinoline 1-oxidoreductase subunit beta
MPGVKNVVQVGEDAVAVIADTWWRAKTALDAVPVEWTDGEGTGYDMARIHAMLEDGLTADEAFVGNQQGDVRRRSPMRHRWSRRPITCPISTTSRWSR